MKITKSPEMHEASIRLSREQRCLSYLSMQMVYGESRLAYDDLPALPAVSSTAGWLVWSGLLGNRARMRGREWAELICKVAGLVHELAKLDFFHRRRRGRVYLVRGPLSLGWPPIPPTLLLSDIFELHMVDM